MLQKRNLPKIGLILLIAIVGLCARPARQFMAQSPEPYVSALAAKEGIVQEPFPHLEGTAPLTLPPDTPLPEQWISPRRGEIYAQQLNQEQTYWLKQIAATPAMRDRLWKPNFSSVEAYQISLKGHRENVRKMLGLSDVGNEKPEASQAVLEADGTRVEDVTLSLPEGLPARALIFIPPGKALGAVIALPDATQSREAFAGIVQGGAPAPWLTSLLERQLVVCVPVTIDRDSDYQLGRQINRRQLLSRLGFIVGRTLVGLEVEQTVAMRNYLVSRFLVSKQQVGVLGDRQGGMTALYAAAVDGSFGEVAVVDYFRQRENCWQEPVDRMLYGELNEFGDAEVAALAAPHPLAIIYTAGGSTPAESVQAELARAKRFYGGLGKSGELTATEAPAQDALTTAAVQIAARLGATEKGGSPELALRITPQDMLKARDAQFEGMHNYLMRLDAASDAARESHWNLLATPPSERALRAEALRRELRQLMGVVPLTNNSLRPRTRLLRITDKFAAYDVLLDVLPGVEVYGQLLIPRHVSGRAPVVICQHGLGDEPSLMIGLDNPPLEFPTTIYNSLGSRLADLGYVVFAPYIPFPVPQEVLVNPLVRQAAALGKMRTSLELAKLHRIIDFLQSLPQADPQRVGYYGLSYGGYSATWMPPLEPRIKADVISGHFNDWRVKITSEGNPESYMMYQDADFYNWNVLNRFTHRELIAAQWPRPVCVEFGERDGTTTPAWHERAWQQVAAYAHAWGLDGLEASVVRDHFDGVHQIHGVGSFAFLQRWLQPREPSGRDYAYLPAEPPPPKVDEGLSDTDLKAMPYVTHNLDSADSARVAGRFHVGVDSPIFAGLAIKLSRVGSPGDVVVRFGSQDGANDIGEVRIPTQSVDPLFELMYNAEIKPVRLDPSKLYYFEVRASSGLAPLDYYLLYGPKPLGGQDYPLNFGLSFEVLGKAPNVVSSQAYRRFGFMRPLLASYTGGPSIHIAHDAPARGDEISINGGWSIHAPGSGDEVLQYAAADLSQFFQIDFKMDVKTTPSSPGPHIDLRVVPSGVEGVNTTEGYRIEVARNEIAIEGLSARGVMRGAYALEDLFRDRKGPIIQTTPIVSNCRFPRRITRAVGVVGIDEGDMSRADEYTDGLLERVSHSGYNGLWVWVNTEEATYDSHIFPELNDPEAADRLARLDDLTRHARRYGIDIYIYFATGYHRHIPESFFAKHPETQGYGWGPPLCSSTASVRNYYAETIGTLFQRAPLVKGLIVIYDSEGFWYCGNSPYFIKECPRCSHRPEEEVAAELLTCLDNAVHKFGGKDKDFIAENYNMESPWIVKVLPLIPKDVIIEGDFNKGMMIERDGIRHQTEDYIITDIGPPAIFESEYNDARAHGLQVTAKTENSVSQEFIFVPYIPCMEQWYNRIAKMRDYDLQGWFGNWFFYGFTAARTEALINRMSFDPAPSREDLLRELAERDFGQLAAPYVLRAWHDFSEGIRVFPYSDGVARYPGPLQRGPSNPFFLDPNIKAFGPARAWQNNLRWTRPWGPEITAKYLGQVEDWYQKGDAELREARHLAPPEYQSAIDSEWRVGRTIQCSVQSTLNLIVWIKARDEYVSAKSANERQIAFATLNRVAVAELENARGILPLLEADSRLGYASDGSGLIRGGLFNPELVRWKIGEMQDLLLRVLPGSAPGGSVVQK